MLRKYLILLIILNNLIQCLCNQVNYDLNQLELNYNQQQIIPELNGLSRKNFLDQTEKKTIRILDLPKQKNFVFPKETTNLNQKPTYIETNQKTIDGQIKYNFKTNLFKPEENLKRIKELNKLSENIRNLNEFKENYDFDLNQKPIKVEQPLINFDEKFGPKKKNEIEREIVPEIDFNVITYQFNNDTTLPNNLNCPICFKLIEDQVIQLKGILNSLTNQLNDIKEYPEVIQDASFQFKLRELSSIVYNLLKDARFAQNDEKNIIKQLIDMRSRIGKLTTIRDSITQLPEIERYITFAKSNITSLNETLFKIESGVLNSRKYIDNQGIFALEKAWERSSKFGRQHERLSNIARESRRLADEHHLDAQEIFKIATNSLNTSQNAFRLAKDAVSTQEGYKLAMDKLRKQWQNTQSLVFKTVKIAEEAHKEAVKAYNDALDLYSKSSMTLPLNKSYKLKQDTEWVMNQALKIINEVNKLLEKYEITFHGSQNKLTNAQALLEQVQQLQVVTNHLLKETQDAYNKAISAVESGELTLKDARNTLKTLKEFDDLVAKSKLKAEEALKKMEEIHNLIKEAELKTDDAEKALKGSLNDALEARDLALEAQKIAEKASIHVRKIKEQAFGIKSKAGDLKKRVDLFNLNIEKCSAQIIQFENEGEDDGKLVKDTLEKANQAKTLANDTNKKIENAMNSLNSILEELNDLQQIDVSLLEELFQRLAKAEQEYKEADLDNRTNILNEAKEIQRGWIIDYDKLLNKLQVDVNNVDKIKQAIPDKCFRRIRLEP